MSSFSSNSPQNCSSAVPFASWEQREVCLWVRSVRSSVLVALALSSAVRFLQQLLYRPGESEYFGLVAGVALAVSVGVWWVDCKDWVKGKIVTIVLLTTTQGYLVGLGLGVYPECTGLWAVASTVVFGLYEIQGFMCFWTVTLQLAKHFTLWYLAFRHSETDLTCGLPFGLIVFGVGLTFLSSGNMRKRAISYWQLYESIRKEKDNLSAVLNAIPEGVIVVTATGEVSSCNPQAFHMLKCSDLPTLTSHLLSLHCTADSEDQPKSCSLLEEVCCFLRENTCDMVTFGLTSRGNQQYYQWKGKRCTWNDGMACILTGSDMTSWRLMETKLRYESESKSSILHFVAHELHTPANAILNMTSNVLSEAHLTPEHQTQLRIVETSTHFLISVVNDLMDFTRMTAEKFRLVKHNFEFRREIEDAVELVRLQCERKGLSLRSNIDSMIPEVVYSDSVRMRQILVSLLGNALKYTYNGGIRVTCILTSAQTVRITVTDTGLGLPYGKQASFTQVFSTFEDGYRVNPRDCGLGLYISNLIALCLGGRPLVYHSRTGGGSEFSFEVDINCERREEVKTRKFERQPSIGIERDTESEVFALNISGGNSLKFRNFPHILIVDDVDFNRMVLLRLLQSCRLTADEAASGLRAIAKIRDSARRGHYYSLIFMDVERPEMDGITATQQIRLMELTGELPVRARIVCCTAHSGKEDIERSRWAGMDEFLAKPLNRDRLRTVVLGTGDNA